MADWLNRAFSGQAHLDGERVAAEALVVGDTGRVSGLRRVAAVIAVLGLVVIAAALGAYALDERNTAEFVRSLVLPGSRPPDTANFDGAGVAALAEAIVALLTAAAARFVRGRPFFAVSAIWSVLALGTGAWIAQDTTPRLSSVVIGPLELPLVFVGAVLVLAAVLCLVGSVVGWSVSPSETAPARSLMPPPTHHA